MIQVPATGYVVLQVASTRRDTGDGLMTPLAHATRGLRMMRGSKQTVLLARRAHRIKRWSLDTRSREQSADSLWGS